AVPLSLRTWQSFRSEQRLAPAPLLCSSSPAPSPRVQTHTHTHTRFLQHSSPAMWSILLFLITNGIFEKECKVWFSAHTHTHSRGLSHTHTHTHTHTQTH